MRGASSSPCAGAQARLSHRQPCTVTQVKACQCAYCPHVRSEVRFRGHACHIWLTSVMTLAPADIHHIQGCPAWRLLSMQIAS